MVVKPLLDAEWKSWRFSFLASEGQLGGGDFKALFNFALVEFFDANDKKRAEEAKIAKEKDVKARLVACNCWTSSSEFIKGGDLKDFIRVNKEHLKSRENYGAQLKFDAAFSFMT